MTDYYMEADSPLLREDTGDDGKNLIYLYCITNKLPVIEKIYYGMSMDFIKQAGIYGVFSKVSEYEFGENNLKKNLNDMDWLQTKVNIHEEIIENIMKTGCVIPFKFATVFYSEYSLKSMLTEYSEKFKETLAYLADKEEWGLKIYCDIEKLKQNISQKDEEVLKTDAEINASTPGRAFFLKKKKEELIIALLDKKLNEYALDSFEYLKKYSISTCINKLLSKEITEREESMILNSVYLIDKNNVFDFVNIVESFKTKYRDNGLFFDCTGPWPPYNFCLQEQYKNG